MKYILMTLPRKLASFVSTYLLCSLYECLWILIFLRWNDGWLPRR